MPRQAIRIGVDASCWPNQRGYGRYTRELLRTLLALDDRNEYRLFLSAATARASDGLPPTARQVIVETSEAPDVAASATGRRSLRDLWAMSRAVRQHGSDLDIFYFPTVYTFFPIDNFLPSRPRTKVVVTIHDAIVERYPTLTLPSRRARLFWNLKVRLAIRQSALISTVSESSRRSIGEVIGLPKERISVIPDAVDGLFHPVGDASETRRVLAEHGLDDRHRLILYVGGISPHKNLATLVEAFGSLLREGDIPELRLILAGDFRRDVFYSSYPSVRDRVEALGLSERITFAGYVSDHKLLHLYNAAEFLVIPSFDEGFGLPALEAMACGTPVVASRAGALPEVVGAGGLFFNPYSSRSKDDLQRCIRQLLSDQQLRGRLAENALRQAARFTWERSARAALAAFEGVSGDDR